MKVKIKLLTKDAVVPRYAHKGDAGIDLFANSDVMLKSGVPTLVGCGFSMELPDGYEAQIRSRSGNALKHGLVVANSPGTVDSGYRGEIGAIMLWNGMNPNALMSHSDGSVLYGECAVDAVLSQGYDPGKFDRMYVVKRGDRIAQMVISRYNTVELEEVAELEETHRGEGGFGSTGK